MRGARRCGDGEGGEGRKRKGGDGGGGRVVLAFGDVVERVKEFGLFLFDT